MHLYLYFLIEQKFIVSDEKTLTSAVLKGVSRDFSLGKEAMLSSIIVGYV